MLPTLNIKSRLILLVMIVALIPLAAVSLVMLNRVHTALSQQAFSQLGNITQSKKTQLERYYARIRADITVLAGRAHFSDALDAFASVLDKGKLDKVQYDYYESLQYGESFRKFLKEYGYYDLMLITRQGDIVYSTRKEADLTQNIRTGPLTKSLLGRVFNTGLVRATVTDFELYAPSDQQPIAFMIAPIALEDEQSPGAVVLKITLQQINQIMFERSGMGRTGEAYLVGPDLTMRSDSFLDPANRSVLASLRNPQQGRVKTESSQRALAGATGQATQDDYRGISVLSAYTPVRWGNVIYALVAKIDEAEAFTAVTELRRLIIFTYIVLLVLISFAALFIATIITRPILALTTASIKIVEGNLEEEISVRRNDELGVLAEHFNRMRLSIAKKISLIEDQKEELKRINEGLEDLVATRTIALEESQQRFELAMKAGDLGLWDWQLKTGKLFVNDTWAQMLGHTKDEITNSIDEWTRRIHPDDADSTLEVWEAYVQGTAPYYQPEFRFRAKDGSFRWILSIGKTIETDEQGNPSRMIGIHLDITERKQMEDELARSKEKADASNQAKSAFLANMSHELRTPLNAILGYSEMLIEEARDLEQDDFIPDLKKINQAGMNLLTLINDVLDLSKIESGMMEAFAESINLDSLIDEISATTQPLISKNGNTFSIERGRQLGSTHQDLTKLRQTLLNLLSNAAKFTHQGTVTLHVERIQQSGEDWLIFAVSDTGIGIAADKIEQIFKEFAQADDSTTRNYGGTGLGLAISQRFSQLLGGNLSVHSKLGEGSTFTIRIPATLPESKLQQPSADKPAAKADVELNAPRDTAPGNTILVIDDDPAACEIIERYLTRDGYSVVTANSGDQGLRLAHEIQPAAITLDVIMPDMDGWSVLRALKADPVLREIPVIMVSMIDDRVRGYTLGAVDYITKPVHRELLHKTLSRYFSADDNSTVLLVEDNEETREIMTHTLEKLGWTVSAAGNGQEALDIMTTVQPRLILLDLMMPVMDGFEFLAAMRARPQWQQIPVIVVTAKHLSSDDRNRLAGSVEQVLEKNAYSREQLLERVRDAVAACNAH